jgi:hypothetical protein
MESRKCIRCNGALRSIGLDRANGKITIGKYNRDWEARQYHKKCWKEVQDHKIFMWQLEGKWPM